LYRLDSGVWDEVVGSLSGLVQDRIGTAIVLDRMAFTNNGADPVQEIDFLADTFGVLGDIDSVPDYIGNFRYITGFANRFVAAADRGDSEVLIAWSGEYPNVDIWNPLTDESAGFTPLLEQTDDLSDHITGIFGFTNIMVVMREKSIWIATKQPIAHDPFNFSSAIAGIGCDSPFSIKIIFGSSLAWLDRRTATVYVWTPGGQPEPIGRPVERTLLDGINDPKGVFGSYDPIHNEYSVCIPLVGSDVVACWTYNFRTQAWTYNEYLGLSSFDNTELATGGVTIDELVGTIDDLVGTIDELSPFDEAVHETVLGRTDGSLMIFDETVDTDAPFGFLTHTGGQRSITPVVFETDIIFKTFDIPDFDLVIQRFIIEYINRLGGDINFLYSLDGNDTNQFWRGARTITAAQLDSKLLFKYVKAIRSRKFTMRITATSGRFDLTRYEVYAVPSGNSSARDQR
jgi:hypothetical protein